MYCRELTLIGTDAETIHLHPLKCKCWKCELCVEMLRRKVVRFGVDGEPTTFLTLTTNPHYEPNPDQAAAYLKAAFSRLIRKARRIHGKRSIEYMAVWEATKAGMPHLHVLLRAPYIPQHWISEEMAREIEAPIVDIRPVKNSKQVAGYVAKYVGKEPATFAGRQHYFKSRRWRNTATARRLDDRLEPIHSWSLIHLRIDRVLARLSSGCTVTQKGENYTLTRQDSSRSRDEGGGPTTRTTAKDVCASA